MDNQTIQLVKASEKAKFMIDFKAKKENDIILYWHYQTIKEELFNDYLKDIRGGF